MGILLSDEEILAASEVEMFLDDGTPNYDQGYLTGRIQVAQAQLKGVVEWGDEDCPHKKPLQVTIYKKSECCYCWQSLKKEVGVTIK